MSTPAVIVPPSIKNFEAVISPLFCIWYPDDEISNFPSDPLMNCVAGLPKKNVSVCTSNTLGFVLYLKKLFASDTSSKPTPSYEVAVCVGNADPENNKNPPGLDPVAWLNPSYPNDLTYPVFCNPTISTPEFRVSATVNDPVSIENPPSMYRLPPSNILFSIIVSCVLLTPAML